MMSDMTLTEFLLARIAEDEARAARAGDTASNDAPSPVSMTNSAFSPARVLAECEAKRQIMESVDVLTGGEKPYLERLKHTDKEDAAYVITRDILRWLALPYVDHPDYREEWRP